MYGAGSIKNKILIYTKKREAEKRDELQDYQYSW